MDFYTAILHISFIAFTGFLFVDSMNVQDNMKNLRRTERWDDQFYPRLKAYLLIQATVTGVACLFGTCIFLYELLKPSIGS